MEYLIIALLLAAGIILLLVELFLIPGFGIFGLAAGGCIIYANYYAFSVLGNVAGICTLIISIAACIGAMVWFMKSKTLDRISLKKNITSQVDRSAEQTMQPGLRGIATTRLALIGYAEIEGKVVEVKSIDGFINEKQPIEVVRITDGVVLVRAIS